MADDLMQALQYGPRTGQALRRSQYLEDALAALNKPQDFKGGWGELASKLAAAMLLQRSSKKADAELRSSYQGEMDAQVAPLDAKLGVYENPTAPATPETAAPAPTPLAQALAAKSGPPMAAPMPAAPVGPAAGDVMAAPQARVETAPLPPAAPVRPDLWSRLEGVESGGKQSAISPKGAFGVAQLMPDTAQEMARRLGDPSLAERSRTDPNVNRQLGQAYLKSMLDRYGGNETMALAAYNAGPGRVDDWAKRFGDPRSGQVNEQDWASRIPFPETRSYVNRLAPGPQQPLMSAEPQSFAPSQVPGAGFPPAAAGPAGAAAPPVAAPAMRGITPEQAASLREALHSPDPRVRTWAMGKARETLYAAQSPMEYETKITDNGQVIQVPKIPGHGGPLVQSIPGYRASLTGNMQYGEDGRAHAIPGTETQTYVAGPGDRTGLTPGTSYSVAPDGKISVLQAPPQGYQGIGGGGGLIPRGPADPAAGASLVQNEAKLRDDYDRDSKNFREARSGYQKVLAAARDNTGVSDIALIFGFMKTLDPNSTVREGEFATAQNSGSIPQSILNAYDKALRGERLQPEQRAQFARTAGQQFAVYERAQQAVNQRYAGLATSYGFDPARVVQNTPSVSAPAQGGGHPGEDQVYARARAAIRAGKPRAAVEQRLRQAGFDPGKL